MFKMFHTLFHTLSNVNNKDTQYICKFVVNVSTGTLYNILPKISFRNVINIQQKFLIDRETIRYVVNINQNFSLVEKQRKQKNVIDSR